MVRERVAGKVSGAWLVWCDSDIEIALGKNLDVDLYSLYFWWPDDEVDWRLLVPRSSAGRFSLNSTHLSTFITCRITQIYRLWLAIRSVSTVDLRSAGKIYLFSSQYRRTATLSLFLNWSCFSVDCWTIVVGCELRKSSIKLKFVAEKSQDFLTAFKLCTWLDVQAATLYMECSESVQFSRSLLIMAGSVSRLSPVELGIVSAVIQCRARPENRECKPHGTCFGTVYSNTTQLWFMDERQ